MRFHFEHIGPIDAADLELGDLTIIAGRNNTGKTYLVYTMYGFLRTWASVWRRPLAERLSRRFGDFLGSEIGSRLSIDRGEVERLRHRTIEQAASRFSEGSISHIFSSPPSTFADACLSVELSADLPSDGKRFSLARSDQFRVAAQYDEDAVELELIWRETSMANRRSAATVQLGRAPLLVVDRIASRYAMPVKDNVDFTRNIENILHRESEFFKDGLHEEVKTLMSGYYTSADGVIRFRSRARKRRSFDIPLHIASSSARGLSDLYFYLRHVASRNDVLFIDEPETHLDTANQVVLAHVISRLVRSGLKILVSTHSDYMIKEVNNLVMLDHLHRNGGSSPKIKGYGPEEGIDRGRIRAYVAEKNTLTPCVVDRYGIDAPVFDENIDRINRASTELASAVEDME